MTRLNKLSRSSRRITYKFILHWWPSRNLVPKEWYAWCTAPRGFDRYRKVHE